MSHGHHGHHGHHAHHGHHGGHGGHGSHEPPQHGIVYRFWRAIIVLMIVGAICWVVIPVIDGFVYAAWMQLHDGRSLYLDINKSSHWTPPDTGQPEVPSGE